MAVNLMEAGATGQKAIHGDSHDANAFQSPPKSLLEATFCESSLRSGLDSCLLMFAAFALMAGSLNIFRSGFAFHNSLGIFAALVFFVAVVILKRGHIALTLRVLVWGLWGLFCFWGFLIAGVRTPALFALPLLITMGGWLLSPRETLILFGATAAVLSLQAWGEYLGWFQIRVIRDVISFWSAEMCVLLCAAMLALTLNRSFLLHYQRAADLTRELERRARYDSLTGLPNRQSILEFLEASLSRASRNNCQIAVLFTWMISRRSMTTMVMLRGTMYSRSRRTVCGKLCG